MKRIMIILAGILLAAALWGAVPAQAGERSWQTEEAVSVNGTPEEADAGEESQAGIPLSVVVFAGGCLFFFADLIWETGKRRL